ncbi:hypothetical protein Dimus_013709 [Dionaea muscipula]
MHTAACKEFYANLTMFHYKKKEVARSRDHELSYGDWMTMVFEAFDVPQIDKQGEEPKRYDFFEETFLTMCQLKRENGVWWLRSGENRRKDEEEVAPVENEEVNEEEEVQNDFDWESVVDEAALQEESGSGEKFYDAEDEVQEPADVIVQDPTTPATFPASPVDSSTVPKETTPAGVDPSGPTGSIADSMFLKLQAELEQARARRLQDDLDKAQAKNARFLALLQQTQSQPKP